VCVCVCLCLCVCVCVCLCVFVYPTQVDSDIAFAAFGDVIHPREKMPSVPCAALHLEAVESEVVVGRPEVLLLLTRLLHTSYLHASYTPLTYTPFTRYLLNTPLTRLLLTRLTRLLDRCWKACSRQQPAARNACRRCCRLCRGRRGGGCHALRGEEGSGGGWCGIASLLRLSSDASFLRLRSDDRTIICSIELFSIEVAT
jgi:hypothetical protein